MDTKGKTTDYTDDTDGGCSHGAVRRPRRVAPKQVNRYCSHALLPFTSLYGIYRTKFSKIFPISKESNHESAFAKPTA